MLTRTPAQGQLALWAIATDAPDPLTAPAVIPGMDPAGMEQPSMFAPVEDAPVPVVNAQDPPAFEACDECGLDIWKLHCDDCGDCYCDGTMCDQEDEG